MGTVKKFLTGRGVGYYLSLLALVCGIAAGALYMATGTTSFNPELNSGALCCIWLAVALCAVTIVVDIKEIRYIAAMLFLYGFMWYLYSQVTYIANVFVAIDGYGFTAGFIATFVFCILSFAVALLAGIFTAWRPWAKIKKAEEAADEAV